MSAYEYVNVLCGGADIPTVLLGDKHLNARAGIPRNWDNPLMPLHLWVQAESGGSQRLLYGSDSLQQLCNDKLPLAGKTVLQ